MSGSWPAPPRINWWATIWQRFWALPLAVALLSVGLGILLPALEALVGKQTPGWVFQGGVDGARSVLSTIAGAMISVTGLVFSITIVVLQLASSQFSPRILRTFLESRIVQLTLGAFTGSFVYSLAVLRAVRGGEDSSVPQLAVTVSTLYVLVSVGAFLAFIHHITTSVQVTEVMADAREGAVSAIRSLAPDEHQRVSWSPRPGTPQLPLLNDDRQGYVTSLDPEPLEQVARQLGAVVELTLTPGEHVRPGQPIGRLWGCDEVSDRVRSKLTGAVHLEAERALHADGDFGVRQLLDIAERALSPGVNDPTTAVQAVNELHVVFRLMAQLPDPSPYLVHEDTVVALYSPQRYGEVLRSAVEELVHYGSDTLRVVPRLGEMLEDLAGVALPQHRQPTESARALLEVGQAEG